MTSRTEHRLSTWAPVVLAVLSLLGGGLAWAAKAQVAEVVAPLSERVARLETGRESDREQAKRIEDKVDFLVERLIK
jgi:outer membrane murein-binding lipoprotein Lpp